MRRARQSPPYLVLLRAGFCLPSVLPRTRCALTAPFHPYLSYPRRYIFCATGPSSYPARALPGALPFGVRTFLSPGHFAVTHGWPKQRSSGRLRRTDYYVSFTLLSSRCSVRVQVRFGRVQGSRVRFEVVASAVALLLDAVLLELLVEIAPGRIDHVGGL